MRPTLLARKGEAPGSSKKRSEIAGAQTVAPFGGLQDPVQCRRPAHSAAQRGPLCCAAAAAVLWLWYIQGDHGVKMCHSLRRVSCPQPRAPRLGSMGPPAERRWARAARTFSHMTALYSLALS